MNKLASAHVLVTRAKGQGGAFAKKLDSLGATAHHLPLIAFTQTPATDELKETLHHLDQFDWLVFTSVNGVHHFFSHLQHCDRKSSTLPKLAAVGKRTAASLKTYGFEVSVTPNEFVAESLAEALDVKEGTRILLARGKLGRKALPQLLKERGAAVKELLLYDTVLPATVEEDFAALDRKTFDYVTLTSSSTARNFANVQQKLDISWRYIACIGPVTAKTAENYGLKVDIVPIRYTTNDLIQAMQTYP
ncbi:uroporphyrinogen-III synthase [Shouchella shacheensis]|uniref:uroporphyrinogen-III synthase n=1 Tax=Shouchella shacheensis TaxID=1649580 RepID=UPI00074049B7|nr:uroporphyrinogen-III synthase [Shouchella shacheensis]